MDVVNDHLGFLYMIEKGVVEKAAENPKLIDSDVLIAYEKVLLRYSREKKRLPAIVSSMPSNSKELYDQIVSQVENSIQRNEAGDENKIPLRNIIACLERLIKSLKLWHAKGAKGYLNFLKDYVKT